MHLELNEKVRAESGQIIELITCHFVSNSDLECGMGMTLEG